MKKIALIMAMVIAIVMMTSVTAEAMTAAERAEIIAAGGDPDEMGPPDDENDLYTGKTVGAGEVNIKGFKQGMTYAEGCQNVKSLYEKLGYTTYDNGKECGVRKDIPTYNPKSKNKYLRIQYNYTAVVYKNANNGIGAIDFYDIDKIFNSKTMTKREFAQAIINNYSWVNVEEELKNAVDSAGLRDLMKF